MDVQIPELDGLAATQSIRATPELDGIPIIAVTALAMPGDRERCLAAGASHYLTKPIQPQHLLALIDQLAHKSSPTNAPVTAASHEVAGAI
jgi:CheY-like chemotaxis protein